MGIGAALMAVVFICIAAVPPPIQHNPFSTNIPPGVIINGNTLILSNNTAGAGGWVQIDTTGLKVFDLKGQEAGRIYLNSSQIAMEYGAGFSGLFTNGSAVIHVRSGTVIPLSIQGDTTSQTTFLIAAYTNSGTAQNVFTVDSGGKIYSRQLLSSTALYSDSSSNIVSASSTALTYLANTQQVNFASTPYQTFQITNDTIFTNQNQAVGRSVAVKMIGGLTNCNLTFPSQWVFIGSTAPALIGSNKTAILSLTAFGTDPTNVIAAYAVQP